MIRHKTRQMTKADWKCPVHGVEVRHHIKMKDDNQGRRKYAGEYYSCPQYADCKYYVTYSGKVPII